MNMCNWLGWVRCQYFPQVNPRMLPPIGARWSVRCSIICAGTDCIILCIPHINTKTVACQITCLYEILPLNLLLESYKWPLTWYFNPTEQMKQYEWIRRYLYYLQDPVSYMSDYMFDAFCTAYCNTPVFGTTRLPVYSPKMCGLHKVYICVCVLVYKGWGCRIFLTRLWTAQPKKWWMWCVFPKKCREYFYIGFSTLVLVKHSRHRM